MRPSRRQADRTDRDVNFRDLWESLGEEPPGATSEADRSERVSDDPKKRERRTRR
jgi:hypothetical protein